MASTAPRNKLALLFLLAMALPAAMSACAGEDGFPSGRRYAACQDLPALGASLHWSYDESAASLSLAFVAAPAAPGGWVAWGINPTGTGMVGAQALLALAAGGASAAPAVRTYNITGYAPVGGASTPIAFPATGLAADMGGGGGGKVRLYATLRLEKGTKVVNQVWQVGSSVTGGAPDMHAMAPENLAARGRLVLAAGAVASSPAPGDAPEARGPSSSGDGDGNGDGSSSQPPVSRPISVAAGRGSDVSAPAVVALALLGFLARRW